MDVDEETSFEWRCRKGKFAPLLRRGANSSSQRQTHSQVASERAGERARTCFGRRRDAPGAEQSAALWSATVARGKTSPEPRRLIGWLACKRASERARTLTHNCKARLCLLRAETHKVCATA